MDGLSSFFPIAEGLNYLVNSDTEVALFHFQQHSFEEYQCKVKTFNGDYGAHIIIHFHFLKQITTVWKAPTPTFTISMYMKKNSPFTRFISNKITKMGETGITNNLSKRHTSEPNCRPMHAKGQKISKCMFHNVAFPKKELK